MENKRVPEKIWKVIKDNPIVVLLVIVCIIVGFTIDNFFSFRNLNSLISNTTVRFLIALGVSGCLITKGTDLSAGRAVGLCACLAGTLLQDPTYTGRMYNWPEFNLFVAFLIVVAVGAAFGLVNGLIISKLNVPPFIATLGTQTIVYGICLVFTNAQPIGNFKGSYKNFVNGTWLKGIFTVGGEDFPPWAPSPTWLFSPWPWGPTCCSCITKPGTANTCTPSAAMRTRRRSPA